MFKIVISRKRDMVSPNHFVCIFDSIIWRDKQNQTKQTKMIKCIKIMKKMFVFQNCLTLYLFVFPYEYFSNSRHTRESDFSFGRRCDTLIFEVKESMIVCHKRYYTYSNRLSLLCIAMKSWFFFCQKLL